ncbi:MAG: hypothetical protein IKF39_06850 [Oscillospiraceae bacterium]|nr:hypothetical protein [Oscillospiraceae bacterium]
MNLCEGLVRDEIFIDFGAETVFGEDQCYVDYPCRFPIVGFQLMTTGGLSRIADRIRKDLGYKPMHPLDEFTDDDCDQAGWYDFFAGLNGFSESQLDSCIEFIVVNAESEDNEKKYSIDLTEEEQAVVYKQLDIQCREYLGKSCEELLAEARKEMETHENYQKGRE